MKLKLILATLLALPAIGQAGVDPKTGNFYITYSDVSLKSGERELEIAHTYNSKATQVGWFGFGWGSRYETRLTVLPDGSAVVRENGAGRVTYYRTKDEGAIKAGVQRIVEAAKKSETLSPAAADQLATELLRNEELRLAKVVKYGLQSELPNGAALDDFCGKASLTRVGDGYRRKDCNRFGDSEPATDTFDLQGRLIRHELSDGYAVTILFTDAGHAEIRDTLGQSIALTWTEEGRIASARANDIEVKYSYDRLDLAQSLLSTGLSYKYSYDNQHNLTRVTYVDDSAMTISYSPSVNGRVDAVTDRMGEKQTYEYRSDPANASHYWTRRTLISSAGQTSTREFEYEDQTSATGVTQPARIAVAAADAAHETRFDLKGRVVRKANSEGIYSEYVYHPRSDKLILVISNRLATEFHYDDQGQLVRAENSDGQVIELGYANSPQIQRLVEINRTERTRRELRFKYNRDGRPTEIALVGSGKITVEYDDKGEIRKVDSAQGAKMALQVTQAFQTLLSVVAVAGAKI